MLSWFHQRAHHHVFSDICKLLGIKKINTTYYRPQANGSLERQHDPLGQYLRSFAKEDGSNWDQWLAPAMHVHNNTVHASTGQTSVKTVYGFELEVPTNLRRKCSPLYNADDPIKVLKFQLQRLHELVKENQIKTIIASKKQYDKKVNSVSFISGEKVLLRNNTRKNKFSPIWLGPYEVVRIISPVTTAIRVKGKIRKWHNNHLRKFHDAY